VRRLLPDPVVGALAGFVLGFLGSFSLDFVGVRGEGVVTVVLGALGAIIGCVVGVFFRGPPGRGKTVARWCAATAAVVGAVGFLAGFVGPMVLRPDSPQGPLLGILCTGPLGAIAGAVVGALIGLVVPGAPARR
jgi:hypothetical protein